jgi:hypothetical protein
MAKRRWVTLRNKRRVQIDENGRIVRGISREARGVHVRDLSPFLHELRDLESADCSRSSGGYAYEERGKREILRDRSGEAISPRYERKMEAVEALLESNPMLFEFVQENWGNDSQAYRHWLEGGQRGSKPQLGAGDGRFDPINLRFDLRGHRRCSSMLGALVVTIPGTYRWEDITPDRLWPLEEVVGFRISPPEQSLLLPMVREQVKECRAEKLERHDVLLETARHGRLPREDVPF